MRQRDDAKAAYETATRALGERRARGDVIQRLLAGLPHLAALREAEGKFAPLADLPSPPAGWSGELARLQAETIRLITQKENAETAIRGLEDELGQIGNDLPALAISKRVDAWRELRSRYDTARDIPVRQAELDGKRAGVADILRRLGRGGVAEPQTLLLSVRTVGALEDLIAARSGVETKLIGARVARDEAKAALAQAREETPQSEGGAAVSRPEDAASGGAPRRFRLASSGHARGTGKAGPASSRTRSPPLRRGRAVRKLWRSFRFRAKRRQRRCASACRKPRRRASIFSSVLPPRSARSNS